MFVVGKEVKTSGTKLWNTHIYVQAIHVHKNMYEHLHNYTCIYKHALSVSRQQHHYKVYATSNDNNRQNNTSENIRQSVSLFGYPDETLA